MLVKKGSRVLGIWLFLSVAMIPSNSKAVQYSIESNIYTALEYHDNIFLTSQEHDSVSKILVAPSARMTAKERNWESFLNARLGSNNYSDHNLDSNDTFIDASGNYVNERDIYTVTAGYDKDSNLNVLSSDFGVTGKRVNHRLWSVSPKYTRLLTERMNFSISYNHTDVEYEDIFNTGYVPYDLDALTGSFVYSLDEKNRISFIIQKSDYSSKDDSVFYKLLISRISIEHQFSELWKADLTIGGSRRNTTNRITQTFDFFGQPISQTQDIDYSDKGYVFDLGIEKKHETGSFSTRISRDNAANSYGGLNQVDTMRIAFNENVSKLWRYALNARYENTTTVSGARRSTDRKTLIFEPIFYYDIDRNWTVSWSYRYIQRKFIKNAIDSTPHSNRFFIGLTYNFPEMSTY